jgi:predicted ATPase
MRLKRIEIDNYKSLRGVVMEPGPLSVLVGPNAAGKTNFCEALDFLAHVYDWSLEKAVEYKGGYDSICYRDSQGLSTDPIRFRVVVEQPAPSDDATLLFDHAFEFGPERTPPSLFPLAVVSEDLTLSPGSSRYTREALRFSRRGDRIEHSGLQGLAGAVIGNFLKGEQPSSGLIWPMYSAVVSASAYQVRHVAGIRVFQLSALGSRAPGIPTPNPNLERFGANLPAVVLHMQRNYPEAYAQLLASLKEVLPDVEDLVVTQTRTLALSLQQRESRRPWPAEDLSDGTIQAIATLAAVFDPRIPVLVLEEPENNVHPWAIRAFAEAFRLASETKQIILTTHSPILIDQFKPEEVWIVQKPGPVTRIDPLLKLDPSLKDSWERGRFTLSEYLDSGARPEAVPVAS